MRAGAWCAPSPPGSAAPHVQQISKLEKKASQVADQVCKLPEMCGHQLPIMCDPPRSLACWRARARARAAMRSARVAGMSRHSQMKQIDDRGSGCSDGNPASINGVVQCQQWQRRPVHMCLCRLGACDALNPSGHATPSPNHIQKPSYYRTTCTRIHIPHAVYAARLVQGPAWTAATGE